MRISSARVAGVCLLALAVLVGLYGLFAILYTGDGGSGETHVTWAGRTVDADLAGAVALTVAAITLLASIAFLRRPR